MFRSSATAPGARRLLLLPATRRLASTKPSTPAPGQPTSAPPAATSSDGDARRQTLRRILLTGGVTLITVVGAITGARIKSDHDASRELQKQKQRDATTTDTAAAAASYNAELLSLDERIAVLEARRARMVTAKVPLEEKIAALRARAAGREEAVQRRGGRM